MLYRVDAEGEHLRDLREKDSLSEEVDSVVFDESLLFEEEGVFWQCERDGDFVDITD